MSLWLYCHFPQLLLDTVCRIHAAANTVPLVYYLPADMSRERQGKAHREPIVQCNQLALDAGVELGQPQTLAQGLVSGLVCHRYNAEKEAQALRQLADGLYQTIDKQVLFAPKGIAIAVDSLLRLYQGLNPLLCHIKEQLQAFHLRFYMSLAYSPEAARCLSQAGCEQLSADKNAIHDALACLPVSTLNGSESRVEKLNKSGIKTLHDLWQLPAAQVGKRFGLELVEELLTLKSTHTAESAAVSFYQPAQTFSLSFDLVTEISHWQGLLFPLKRALRELETFLYQRQKVTRLLDIRLHHRDNSSTRVPLKLAVDSWRASQFLQLIQLQVDRYPLRQPVIAISLTVEHLYELDRHSGQLLNDSAQHKGDLHELLARLQAKLGEKAIYSPAVTNDFRPLFNEQKKSAGSVTNIPIKNVKRPLWLLPQPEPVDIAQWRLIEGPERISSGWWDDKPMARDYWIASDPMQRLGWLFFEKEWYLQGWFS